MFTKDNKRNAHNMITHIFEDLFPAKGMPARPVQIELSHRMLDTLLNGRIALCDAGTGIGKTYAYLVAGAALHRCRAADWLAVQPIVISTSSIALQRAVLNEYLPLLSRILLEEGLIQEPFQAVIRKGKSHYVCDKRLEKRLRKANLHKKNAGAVEALLSLHNRLDMDDTPRLSGYDRERICVPKFCDCDRHTTCRYRRFLDNCNSGARYHFQVCNHNLLLADAIHQEQNHRLILPAHTALIIDEAHKLPEAAQQMFGVTLCSDDIQEMVWDLRAEQFLLAADNLEEASQPLQRWLRNPWDASLPAEVFIQPLNDLCRRIQIIERKIEPSLASVTRSKLEALSSTVSLLCGKNRNVLFSTAPDEHGGTMLYATLPNLATRLQGTLWRQPCGMVLTSATLAVGDNFRRYKEAVGLLTNDRVMEFVALSPFDYQRNCLLYLPQFPPRQKKHNYFDVLANEITALLNAANGHALVLFTSYAAMSAVKERLNHRPLRWLVFTLGRNALHTVEQFKQHPGGVLLATGAAWEGFDFPGDCVSLLIIPHLPFAYPDAKKEQERANYPTLRDFIQAVAVPEMQIKLRQGFGRAIRTETDTCVVAILDERSIPGGRYSADVIESLPEMKSTRSLKDVKQFLRAVKSDAYFL